MVREVKRITDAGFALSVNMPVVTTNLHGATLYGEPVVEPATNRTFLFLYGWRDREGNAHRIEHYVPLWLSDPHLELRWLGGEILDALVQGVEPLQAIGGAALTLAGAQGEPARIALPWS